MNTELENIEFNKPCFGLGYLFLIVFDKVDDLILFRKVIDKNKNIFPFKIQIHEFNILPIHGLEYNSKFEDDLNVLRNMAIIDYSETNRKSVVLTNTYSFSRSPGFKEQADNVFKVVIHKDTTNPYMEFEVVKIRGNPKNISGSKFTIDLPSEFK